ncbi:unnamed protein product, partial [Prorocentrum cordatum]
AGRREAAPIRAPVPRAARSGALEERPPPHRLQLARRAARPCGQGRRGAQGHRARGARSHAAAACGREGEAELARGGRRGGAGGRQRCGGDEAPEAHEPNPAGRPRRVSWLLHNGKAPP